MIHTEFLLHRHPANPLIKPMDFPGGDNRIKGRETHMPNVNFPYSAMSDLAISVCPVAGSISGIVGVCLSGK